MASAHPRLLRHCEETIRRRSGRSDRGGVSPPTPPQALRGGSPAAALGACCKRQPIHASAGTARVGLVVERSADRRASAHPRLRRHCKASPGDVSGVGGLRASAHPRLRRHCKRNQRSERRPSPCRVSPSTPPQALQDGAEVVRRPRQRASAHPRLRRHCKTPSAFSPPSRIVRQPIHASAGTARAAVANPATKDLSGPSCERSRKTSPHLYQGEGRGLRNEFGSNDLRVRERPP